MPASRTKPRPRPRLRPGAPPDVQDPLAAILNGIASDPDAGPWASWARKLLAGDQSASDAAAERERTRGRKAVKV
jgi:hypothetical protein